MHILIVDDNQEILLGLTKLLIDAGVHTDTALTLHEAGEKISEQNYDLIILDWILPDGSGVDFLRMQRTARLSTPVMMLSSKSDAVEKAEALDAGADDYMHKPFSHVELIARIRALLRREATQKKAKIEIGNLSVDFATRRVLVEGEEVKLSKKEFELLELLLLNTDITLTRYQIEEHLNRDFNALKTSNIVDAHIKNLRKKLGAASGLIKTVRGVGFTIRSI